MGRERKGHRIQVLAPQGLGCHESPRRVRLTSGHPHHPHVGKSSKGLRVHLRAKPAAEDAHTQHRQSSRIRGVGRGTTNLPR